MKKTGFEASSLWRDINKEIITKQGIQSLDNFKSGKINHKITLWNPQTNGVRYVKTLIYNLCSSFGSEDWKRMGKIKHRDIGSPIAVKFNNQSVCLDYIQALYEMNFISAKSNLNHKKIFEIGAGYGRTCHAIISNYNVESYHIVDLENELQLSQQYLKKVLTKKQFSKITFLSNEDMPKIQDRHFDLAINIDSLAEMDEKVVHNYLDYIDRHCGYFYAKNPVGKYWDKSLDNHSGGKRAVVNAMKAGVLRQRFDFNDYRSGEKLVPKFIKAYRPGVGWKCVGNSWARPWSYYWQALYKKA